MTKLRNMRKSDLQQVNLILSKSFTHARMQNGLKFEKVPLCRKEFLEMYLAANPEASFVIVKKGKIIAYCFSRLWGSVGWIGPLSVIPSEEGQGYGKNVVLASVNKLKKQGAKTIGLEMPSHSNRNLAFYTKLGFVPGKLTVDFIYQVPAPKKKSYSKEFTVIKYGEVTDNHKKDFLKQTRDFSGQFEPGLDYSSEIDLTAKFNFGDAYLFTQSNETRGFVLAHTEPYSSEEKRQYLKINILQMSSELPTHKLDYFLREIENWAHEEQLTGVYLRVPTQFTEGYNYILSKKYTIVNSELRMNLKGYAQQSDPGQINFSKWE